MGGYCDTPMIYHWQKEPLELPPRQPSKGPSHGGHMGLLRQPDALPQAALGVRLVRVIQDDGGEGFRVLAEFEQSNCYVA